MSREEDENIPPPALDAQPALSRHPDAPLLFVDPLLGASLPLYLDHDIDDRDSLIRLIRIHGGHVVNGYTNVPYILVDPRKDSGRALCRQYAPDKGKVVLDARWIRKCVELGQLQSYQSNFAGCRVTLDGSGRDSVEASDLQVKSAPDEHPTSDQVGIHASTGAPLLQGPMLFTHEARPVVSSSSSQPWCPPDVLETGAPDSRNPDFSASGPWADHFDGLPQHPSQAYDYHFRSDWTTPPGEFYTQAFGTSVPPYDTNFPAPVASSSNSQIDSPRGRKRTRTRAAEASKRPRVTIAARPVERSPTPPSIVQKSNHGGNHFTEEDVKYLEKYIHYCQNQGLPLSLREICEKLAVKAPHHTFYSWRRYCNKHQIRLGGYEMEPSSVTGSVDGSGVFVRPEDVSPSSGHEAPDPLIVHSDNEVLVSGIPPHGSMLRDRSPSPPRLLFRSTTGKGIAFTDEDVRFLVRYMTYWRSKGDEVDMVQFWRKVAEKAPHHSRASWMKYWRRHKHELEGQASIPPRPDKKRKYDLNDDLLLAKYFAKKPDGTSDVIFQAFAREHPHHPWKGWQEHHRIHKAKIDQITVQISNGEVIQAEMEL